MRNKNKIYYACVDGICDRFLEWGISTGGGITGGETNQRRRHAKSLNLKVDRDFQVLKDENKMIYICWD